MLIALTGADVRIKLGAQLVEKLIEACVGGPHSGVVRIHRHFRGSCLPRAKESESPAATVGRSVGRRCKRARLGGANVLSIWDKDATAPIIRFELMRSDQDVEARRKNLLAVSLVPAFRAEKRKTVLPGFRSDWAIV